MNDIVLRIHEKSIEKDSEIELIIKSAKEGIWKPIQVCGENFEISAITYETLMDDVSSTTLFVLHGIKADRPGG